MNRPPGRSRMAWALDWLLGLLPPPEEDEVITPPHERAERADNEREQEQLNLFARRGEQVLASMPGLPPLQRARSGMVLPCMCCPPSPTLVSAVCARLPKRWSPTWEGVEGGAIVVVLNLLLWGIMWALLGEAAGPLSAPFYVIMLSLAGHGIGAVLSTLTPFPPMYGMLLLPAIAGNLDIKDLEVLANLRSDIAAVVVFSSIGVFVARVGIDVDLAQLQSSSGLVLALAFLPLFAETAVVSLAATYILDLSWRWGFLLGTLTAPVSPLVVMYNALELRRADLGTATGVPSLLLVVSALDATAALCLFSVALQCALDNESWTSIAAAFVQLVSGIMLGAAIGFFAIYVPNEYNAHATFYRVEMLLAVNICSVIMFHYFLGMPAVGYLSAFTTACVAANGWETLSMDAKKTTLRTMMSLGWLILQPLAMSIIGPHMTFTHLGEWRQLRFIGVLFVGLAVRLVVAMLCCATSRRRWKEQCFLCISCVPKGTVQLVTCSWTLLRKFPEAAADEDQALAAMVMDCCVLALLLTGPLGCLLSALLAPRLLRGPRQPPVSQDTQEPQISY